MNEHSHIHTAQAAKIIDWKLGMSAEEQAQNVKVNTAVVFKWNGAHNVYIFPSKAAFDSCNFDKATKLGTTSPYTYKASSPGVFYFGCEVGSHCKDKQKLALTVAGTGGEGGKRGRNSAERKS